MRSQKTVTFINLNDGSCLAGLQIVISDDDSSPASISPELLSSLTTGCSITATGILAASTGSKQQYDFTATALSLLGPASPTTYPLAKKKHSLEYLRAIAHLRPRANTFAAVSRVRSTLKLAIHRYFEDHDFVLVDTPIVTASDCEGAGEMFRVTTLDPSYPPTPVTEETVAAKGGEVRRLKESNAPKDAIAPAIASLKALKAELANPTTDPFSKDFFGKPAYLTVSGQLSAETYACALGDVYTFGPTFRAENSQTTRHLAEFHMLEPEMAFRGMEEAMDNAEGMLKFAVGRTVGRCGEDLEFFEKFYSEGLSARASKLVEKPFARVSYREAVELLREEIDR